MLGIIHDVGKCKFCNEIEDPLEFFKRGGKAEELINAEDHPINFNGVPDGRRLFIIWHWDFKVNVMDRRSPRPISGYREHLNRTEFIEHIRDEELPLTLENSVELFRIPETRVRDIYEFIEESRSRMVPVTFAFNQRIKKFPNLTVKKALGANQKSKVRCHLCKQPAALYPITCDKSEHHLTHYFCVVKRCRELEEQWISKINFIRCPADGCVGTLPLLIGNKNKPGLSIQKYIFQGTEDCDGCDVTKFVGETHEEHPEPAYQDLPFIKDFQDTFEADLAECLADEQNPIPEEYSDMESEKAQEPDQTVGENDSDDTQSSNSALVIDEEPMVPGSSQLKKPIPPQNLEKEENPSEIPCTPGKEVVPTQETTQEEVLPMKPPEMTSTPKALPVENPIPV